MSLMHISEAFLNDENAYKYAKELLEKGTFEESVQNGLSLYAGKRTWWTKVMLAGLYIQTKGFTDETQCNNNQ